MKAKSLRAWCAVATAMALTVSTAAAHGFTVPGVGTPAAGGSAGGATSTGSSTNSGNSGAAASNAGNQGGGNTPGAAGGGAGPGRNGGGGGRNGGGPALGGATGGRGGGGRGLPFGLGRRRRPAAEKPVNVDASPKAMADALPSDPAARGKKLHEMLRADAAKDSDVSYVLETSTTDARLRNVDLRIRVSERRRTAGDVRRRVEIDAKRGDQWELVEVNLLRRVAGQLEAVRWTPAGGTSRVKNAADAAVAGTAVRLGDLAPFDVAGSLRHLSSAQLDGATTETYAVNSASAMDENRVTFRMDLRAPVRSELRRGGELRRAYDWSGWRFVAGMAVPSRLTVTGGAGESAVLEYREAAAVAEFDASLFDAAKLGAK